MTTFSRCQHYWKIIYYTICYYIFQKDYSIYHTKQTVATHLFTGRKQIKSIHVNYIKTFIHGTNILWYACTFKKKKVQIVSAEILRAFIITRSHICVPICNLRKEPRILIWNQKRMFNLQNIKMACFRAISFYEFSKMK